MRIPFPLEVESCRVQPPQFPPTKPGDTVGYFEIIHPETGNRLRILAADSKDWHASGLTGMPFEHVSISKPSGVVPNWAEMCFVKDLFWREEETVIQYHPPKSQYVNYHNGTLHLWKPVGLELPLPDTRSIYYDDKKTV